MRKYFVFVFAILIVVQLSAFTTGAFADTEPVDELGTAAETSPSIVMNEFLHASGSFWRPTMVNHASATFGLGILDWDVINASGLFLDFTLMSEYSIEKYTNMPLSVFAQTGLGIHYLDFVESDTNIGLLNLWLGAKYRMFNGAPMPNLMLSFIGALSIGWNDGNDDVGNAQFAGPYLLNSGDFSLIGGALATFKVNDQMGVGGSMLLQLFFWEHGTVDKTELGILMHFEAYYVVSPDITSHVGLSACLDDDIDSQNWKLFAQAMHVSGMYGQVVIPLEDNGYFIVLMFGYNIPFA